MVNNFKTSRSDIIFEKRKLENNIISYEENNFFYHIIKFNNINDKLTIKNNLIKVLKESIKALNIKKNSHFLIVGLGNDNHTADSVGPKVLKHIKVNSHLINLGITNFKTKISALEPGVLGETGIETTKIITSVTEEINPDFIIFIDSYVSEDIKYLNKSIQITNEGITPGSGLGCYNLELNNKILGIPVLVIGIPTAIEVSFDNDINYILSTKDIDSYVLEISTIIGQSINNVLYHLFS